ncbi:MAG: NeuD/PglB/VioB family sugar acetyltransferase [Muribaculaceae bacterium]|nr:NeuD/PglB/VioB family sugar acetyltransferase [Muribaculaceae bacterium]
MNVFGAGGHARVVADIVEATGREVGCFYDDAPRVETLKGHPVVRPTACVDHTEHTAVESSCASVTGPLVVAIGANKVRKEVAERYCVEYQAIVAPGAIVAPSAKMGEGSVVLQGAVIQTDATVGCHCIVNIGAMIDHDCEIGDFVHVAQGVALGGGVKIGEGTWIGAGSVVTSGVKIGCWRVIPPGSVITEDFE